MGETMCEDRAAMLHEIRRLLREQSFLLRCRDQGAVVDMSETGCDFDSLCRQAESRIDTEAQQAIKAFDRGDAVGLLCTLHNSCAPLSFVSMFYGSLLERGIFEESLVFAWGIAKTNHRWISYHQMRALIGMADRDRLLASGSPLPDGEILTVYRGVAGTGRARRVRGFSWTTDLEIACWFALRFGLDNPAVFTATVTRGDVFWCDTDREAEVVCCPTKTKRMALPAAELQRFANAYTKRKRG